MDTKGSKGKGTKSKERIDRFEKLNEKSGITEKAKLEIETLSARLGKKTVEIQNITKSFGEQSIIKNFEHIILRDDRVGIVGKNGCGKSTLLNIISGKLTPDSGSVIVGETVKMGYFSQNNEEMDLSLRVIDFIKEIAGIIETADGTSRLLKCSKNFCFRPSCNIRRSANFRAENAEGLSAQYPDGGAEYSAVGRADQRP